MEYDFDHLGAVGFQSLTRDLVGELTRTPPAATSRSSDWEVEGRLLWPTGSGGELWEGPTLFITEFDNAGPSGRRAAGLTRAVETRLGRLVNENRAGELDNLPQAGLQRAAPLRRIVVATNSTFREAPQDELATLRTRIVETADRLGLDGWALWHGVDYGHMLDSAPRTRLRYLSLLVRTTVVDRIADYDIGIGPKSAAAIKRLLVGELQAEKLVKLAQTGDPLQVGLPLHSVGIDLPLVDKKLKAAQFVIAFAETPALRRESARSNILLLGGPGHGKSTIAQMVAQCYRVALLKGSSGLGTSAGLMDLLEKGLQTAGIYLPRYPRYPIRIELAKYVAEAAGPKQVSILKYVVDQMEKRSPGAMDIFGLRAWLRAWPWLVILDGLDEVASRTDRAILQEQIAAFSGEVDVAEADVVIVATTRPEGYDNAFSPDTFQKALLAPLGQREAAAYGSKLAAARYPDDEEMKERIEERIRQASRVDLTAHLMRSPLQVTIMSMLLEEQERAPQSRFELYDTFYDRIYKRERGKTQALDALLSAHRNDINALHNWLGLLLQAKLELAGDSDASLNKSDLKNAALALLIARGHDRDTALDLAEQISKAVTDRLVLIVSREDEKVGFEVRSIQEFFAGRALATGSDTEIPMRLGAAVESAHWRNTWLFAAGKVFLQRDYMQDDLLNLLHVADSQDSVRMVVMPGADLALDLLEDDLAAPMPHLQRVLAGHALELLRLPPDQDLGRRAATLLRLAIPDTEIRFMLNQAIDAASHAGSSQRKAAEIVLEAWTRTATALGFEFRPQLRQLQLTVGAADARAQRNGPALDELISSMPTWETLTPGERELMIRIVDRLRDIEVSADGLPRMRTSGHAASPISDELLDYCADNYTLAKTLAEAMVALSSSDWMSGTVLRNLLRAALQRRQVGSRLLELTQIIPFDGKSSATNVR